VRQARPAESPAGAGIETFGLAAGGKRACVGAIGVRTGRASGLSFGTGQLEGKSPVSVRGSCV